MKKQMQSPYLNKKENKENKEQKQRTLATHPCENCGTVLHCEGDENGNHATDDCVCEQAVLAFPTPHLGFYCSYECERAGNEPSDTEDDIYRFWET